MAKGTDHYDDIADEYYTPRRRTSRNFDRATIRALSRLDWSHSDLPYLECGAGRGRTREFLGVQSLGIHIDISERMLRLTDREPSCGCVQATCLQLPISNTSVDLMTAWLFDCFNHDAFLSETHRVLRPGGEVIASLPSVLWGMTARQHLRISLDRTVFEKADGSVVDVPSVLSSTPELRLRLAEVGLDMTDVVHGFPDESTDHPISPHIALVASALKVEVEDVPIVTVFRAVRSPR